MTASGLTEFVWCIQTVSSVPRWRVGCCGPPPCAFSVSAVHPGAWTCGRKTKKDPELVTGMVTISLDYSQLFPISKQGCKGKSVVVEYLPKGKCCLVSVQPRRAWLIGQGVLVCHVSR